MAIAVAWSARYCIGVRKFGEEALKLNMRYPETPRNSGWPTVSGQPLRCLNVIESSYGILGASWM